MRADRRILATAAVASLLVHAAVLVVLWNVSLFAAAALRAEDRLHKDVELVLLPAPATSADDSDRLPNRYTAVPERLATAEPPENPDFLALHNARAADLLPGGRPDDQPGAERATETPQIALSREQLDSGGGVAYSPEIRAEGAPQPGGGRENSVDREAVTGEEAFGPGDWALASPREEERAGAAGEGAADTDGERVPETPDWMTGGSPSVLKQGSEAASGDRGFDFNQVESSRTGANVSIAGAFSLNTYEWDFAPWMHRFEQDLHRSWRAPYAYALGVISGKTVIRLVVERNGRPSAMEVLETEGHESLHKASTSALQAFAPYAPLPPNFPEEQLVIILTLHYPAWKR